MNKIVSGLLAATLSVSFAATAAGPAGAAGISQPQAPSASSDVQAIDHKPWRKHRSVNRNRNFSQNFRKMMAPTGMAIAAIVTTIAAIAVMATTGSRWRPSPPAR